jgi:prephenate dehydrogenase
MTRFAIIGGAGKMGRWLAAFLKENGYEVVLADANAAALRATARELDLPAAASNREAVAGADFVLVAVPIESFEKVIAGLAPAIVPGQAVLDVTSTKTVPVEVMHRLLPRATVLGAHPLFGPGARSIAGKNVVLTPDSDTENALAERVRNFLVNRGARVSLMTAAEHDEMMSLILGLSHFIALVTADTLLGAGKLHPMDAAGSSTYKVLLTLVESVLSEDPDLYASIQMSLPRVTHYERQFGEKTAAWADLVARGDRAGFARRMRGLKNKLAKAAPDFETAYEKMYRLIEGL